MADIADMDLNKLKVPELKQALKDRGLPVSGTKPELIKRLGEALGTSVDSADDSIEDSLQGIDDILNDDEVPVATKKPAAPITAPVSTTKPVTSPVKTAVTTQKADAVSSNGVAVKAEAGKPSTTQSTIAGKPAEASKLSAEERLKMRAEKFGASSLDAKKEQRAQRFGLPTSGSGALGKTAAAASLNSADVDLLKKRAERFGSVVSTSLSKIQEDPQTADNAISLDEEEKKKKRAERFGVVSSSTAPTKRPITVNSTDPEVEAKKKKRAERFGMTT